MSRERNRESAPAETEVVCVQVAPREWRNEASGQAEMVGSG